MTKHSVRVVLGLAIFFACQEVLLRCQEILATTPTAVDLSAELQATVTQHLEALSGTDKAPRGLSDRDASSSKAAQALQLFQRHCVGCHGETGDGKGEAAGGLRVSPRDFTAGLFKRTSTPYGEPPLESDIRKVLKRGIPGTAMPRFSFLKDEDITALATLVMAFAQRGKLKQELVYEAFTEDQLSKDRAKEIALEIVNRWNLADERVVRAMTPRPANRKESIEKGRLAYFRLECNTCHASNGRGKVRDSVGVDAWGHSVPAPDLTTGKFRHGDEAIDLYRSIAVGVTGTPMPGYYEALKNEPETVWNLVDFVEHLSEQ